MNWEVRTMRSKISFFNGTLFRKNLTRFWPLWGGASFLGALFPLALWLNISRGDSFYQRTPLEYTSAYYSILTEIVPIICLLYAILCAMAVWSYLYNARSVGMLHTLPIRREGLFAANFLSGMAMMLIPYAVTGALCVLVSVIYGNFDPAGLISTILGVLGLSFFYFASATCVAFVTGNLFALPALYFLLHFLAAALEWILTELASCFLVGVNAYYTGASDFLSPTIHFLMHLGVDRTYEEVERISSNGYHYTDSVLTAVKLENFWIIGVYALVGAALAAIALALYRRRRSESAGDVVAVGWMKPLFRYGLAATAALVGGRALYALFWEDSFQNGSYAEALPMAVCMAVAGVIGYYIASMLLAKSLKVFRGSWIGAGAVLVACAALCAVLRFDLLGIESRVPEAGTFTDVRLYAADNSYTLCTGEDDALISDVLALHRAVIHEAERLRDTSWRHETTEDGKLLYARTYITLTYTLENGREVHRSYDLPLTKERMAEEGTYEQLLDQLVNQQVMKEKRLHLNDSRYTVAGGSLWRYTPDGAGDEGFDLNSREAKTILEAVGQDTQNGNWGDVTWFDSDRDSAYALELSLYFDRREENSRVPASDQISITVRPKMVHTLDCLDALGLIDRNELFTWGQLDAYNDAEVQYTEMAVPVREMKR